MLLPLLLLLLVIRQGLGQHISMSEMAVCAF